MGEILPAAAILFCPRLINPEPMCSRSQTSSTAAQPLPTSLLHSTKPRPQPTQDPLLNSTVRRPSCPCKPPLLLRAAPCPTNGQHSMGEILPAAAILFCPRLINPEPMCSRSQTLSTAAQPLMRSAFLRIKPRPSPKRGLIRPLPAANSPLPSTDRVAPEEITPTHGRRWMAIWLLKLPRSTQ